MEALELATAEDPPVEAIVASASTLSRDRCEHETLPSLLRHGRGFSRERIRDWYRGYEIGTGRLVLVPADAVRVDGCRDLEAGEADYWQSSDGLAAGNTLEEAVLQALLERIERDATALWTLAGGNELRAKCIDPRSLGSNELDRLVSQVEGARLRLRLFDITSDVGIPCHYCVIGPALTPPRRLFDLAAGAGCHLTAPDSAVRAVLEAAQSRLTVIAGLRDDFLPSHYAVTPDLGLLDYLDVDPIAPSPSSEGCDCMSWAGIVSQLEGVGVARLVFVPLAAPASPFAVAKVFAEGLEHPPGARAARFGRRALSRMMS
jgi:ribosomal protein S12 methylthiotransferase accessory factor